MTIAHANPHRGEIPLALGEHRLVLRPSFAALVQVEAEIGSLFAMIERAGAGGLALADITTLFWHCLAARDAFADRDAFGEALIKAGIANVTPAYRALVLAILEGLCPPAWVR